MLDSVLNQAAPGDARKFKSRATDGSKYLTPHQLAERWGWHTESVRRMLRERRMASVIVSRRRLVPLSEIERTEAEGCITRAAS